MDLLLNAKPSISVKKYEQQVKTIEGIPLILRCASNLKTLRYPYRKAAPSSWTIEELIKKRIKPNLLTDLEIEIRRPNGKIAHRGTKIGTMRKQYKAV